MQDDGTAELAMADEEWFEPTLQTVEAARSGGAIAVLQAEYAQLTDPQLMRMTGSRYDQSYGRCHNLCKNSAGKTPCGVCATDTELSLHDRHTIVGMMTKVTMTEKKITTTLSYQRATPVPEEAPTAESRGFDEIFEIFAVTARQADPDAEIFEIFAVTARQDDPDADGTSTTNWCECPHGAVRLDGPGEQPFGYTMDKKGTPMPRCQKPECVAEMTAWYAWFNAETCYQGTRTVREPEDEIERKKAVWNSLKGSARKKSTKKWLSENGHHQGAIQSPPGTFWVDTPTAPTQGETKDATQTAEGRGALTVDVVDPRDDPATAFNFTTTQGLPPH